jgi:hypothetical protein
MACDPGLLLEQDLLMAIDSMCVLISVYRLFSLRNIFLSVIPAKAGI